MITRITTSATHDVYVIDDNAGQRYHVDERLAAEAGGYRDRLEPASERWALVNGAADGLDPVDATAAPVSLITAFKLNKGDFIAVTQDGGHLALTPSELKTIMNARDIHNAKVRGVEPPASPISD